MQQAQNANGVVASVLTIRGKPINPWLVLVSLVFGFFMALLDATIVNIAIPSIQANLHTDLTTVSWVLNAYNLVFAVLLVTAGRFADLYGRKRLFMIGMIIFSLGSLLCALAETVGTLTGTPGISWLIGFRAVQAIGAAALNPVSLAIITVVFPAEKRGAAIGVWGALTGLAAAAGPVLGGFLVQNFDWRWIFFVNLPFCLIGLVMVWFFVPETRDMRASRQVDVPGVLLLSVSIFCLVLAIIQGNSWGWFSLPTLGLFVVTLLGLAVFGLVEARSKEPIVDFDLFKNRSFSASNMTIFLFGIAIQGAFLVLVLYFIDAQGYDQLGAAYAVLPIPLAAFVVSALSGRLSGAIRPLILAIIGLSSLTLGLGLLATLNVDSSYFDSAWRGALIGVGMGLIFTSIPNIVLSSVPRSKLGVGSGIFNTFRQIGFTLGVAILISALVGQLATNTGQAQANSIALVQADTSIPLPLRQAIVAGLEHSSGQSSAGSFDLTKLANRLPPQEASVVKPKLAVLGAQIGREYKTQVIDAFKFTWLLSALVAALALVLTVIANLGRRPRPLEQGEHVDRAPVEAGIHAL